SEVAVFEVAVFDGDIIDGTRNRRIPYRAYVPIDAVGDVPVVVVSHGGQGSDRFFRSGAHLGSTFAAHGMLAVHIGHLPSQPGTHRLDRPADVTEFLDQLDAGSVELPDAFSGVPDLTRVGHAGHSFGAYTSHAVG
ncbi:MAG: hypothetical protein AAFP84_08935, partial [Actinomycetota bacterium]